MIEYVENSLTSECEIYMRILSVHSYNEVVKTVLFELAEAHYFVLQTSINRKVLEVFSDYS